MLGGCLCRVGVFAASPCCPDACARPAPRVRARMVDEYSKFFIPIAFTVSVSAMFAIVPLFPHNGPDPDMLFHCDGGR
eukprot:6203122-Prymnesium_polylepis.1